MKIHISLLSLSLSFIPASVAQTPASQPSTQQQGMSNMPGMHQDMSEMKMNNEVQPKAAENPAQQTGMSAPAPELLQEVMKREPLELSQFQQFALASNPTLGQAKALVSQSAGLARQAGLFPNPTIGYQGEQIRGGDYHGGEQGAFVQQNFVLGGKLSLRRNVYEQQRRESQIGVEEQQFRVQSDIGQQFYATLAAQETVALRRRLLGVAMDSVETAHQLANVGQADAPDVLQSEVEAEQAKLDYTTAQRTFLQEFGTLAALAGKPELPVSPLKGNLEIFPAIDADHVVEQITQNSPSVKRAEQGISRAEAELNSSKRESVPDVQVRAGLENNFERINELTQRPVGVQGFVTAGISIPLFNRNQGNVAASTSDLRRAQSEVNRVRLLLRQGTQPLVQGYLTSQEEAARYKNEMIPRATKAYKLYLAKYQSMGAAYPEVIVSQRTLFQLQVAYIGLLAQLWRQAISLQNFMLSNGLSAPQQSGSMSTSLNLPSLSGAGVQ